jgi:hypothetical protein
VLNKSSVRFGVGAALLATAAFAQVPQPPARGQRPLSPGAAPLSPPQPGGPTTTGQATQPPAGGPRGEAAPRAEGPPPLPSKAAHFRVEQGDNGIEVKCADDEPMRACADITMQFLDRLGITQSRTTGSAPQR